MIPENMWLSQERFPSNLRTLLFVFSSGILFIGLARCTDDPSDEPAKADTGKIVLNFDHKVDGQPIRFDTLIYTNAAGNPYLVNEIQYFISEVTLYCKNKDPLIINEWKELHYVDTDIPGTQVWQVYDKVPAGDYDSLNFRFGISAEKNISFMFPNPPERDMFWPEYLGGGYHYMKLNGKWMPAGQSVQTLPFDFHMGIGQFYFNNTDSIIGFIHNDFVVSLKNSSFQIIAGETNHFTITMNVEKWFTEPNVYDHDKYGGYIMQNQEAMQKAKENGHNVFTFAKN